MGIERTDEWLREDFYDPLIICSKLQAFFVDKNESELYQYLLSFGMYRPSRITNDMYHEMLEMDLWKVAGEIWDKYRRKWSGPDIPVYIFPFGKCKNPPNEMKGGVSFKNGMFLFLSPFYKDEKEIEALIVHEYHHVCRLNKLMKRFQEYTLLDSLVMEGFAEYAVTNYCGDSYSADWIADYSDQELAYFWERSVKEHLQIKRNEPIHDAILFGRGRYPALLGYALGYWLIKKARKKRPFSIQETFSIKSEELLD
ncbi:DUF2268 domain-containing protein [Bacillus tuaregi]|uniref:DUF2268 domain-containing protein n=1 Tax=Bacillus tuaregi TaxID=1816695 RepID=UPI0008F7F7F2|nr:DUF2268 domain-containing putative Zn-dependent protease [Bacillus tuaregi]